MLNEVRPRKDKRGVDLISDALPFGRLSCQAEHNQQRDQVRQVFSRSRDAAIRVYDEAGNMIETYEHTGDFPRTLIS